MSVKPLVYSARKTLSSPRIDPSTALVYIFLPFLPVSCVLFRHPAWSLPRIRKCDFRLEVDAELMVEFDLTGIRRGFESLRVLRKYLRISRLCYATFFREALRTAQLAMVMVNYGTVLYKIAAFIAISSS